MTGQIARARQLEILHLFASRQARLKSLDDIVWNIAKTAIGELGFEDCVVYLLDDDGVTLRQVAAHGPKNPVAREIYNSITIKIGEGIVGHVAATGDVQLIHDARLDDRYIEDDDFRLSELAVPITHDGHVIGVLDSEHHAAHFFTTEDVQLFSTIATLASTRIDAAIALSKLHKTVNELTTARALLEEQAEHLLRARAAAEAASAAKSNFLANMSHEIRTPMTAIVGFAELLAAGDATEQQQALWRNQLTRNARYLQDLIGNILDVSAVEAGASRVTLSQIPITPFLTDIVEIFRPKVDAKGLSLSLTQRGSIPDIILSDRHKLQAVLVNLISNAVKYTECGEIVVELSSEEGTNGSKLSIAVKDSGIGISEAAIAELFNPFSRVHDTERFASIEGTGLGLSLAQKFAELIGGRISVSSRLNEGSVFCFEFVPEVPAIGSEVDVVSANPFKTRAVDAGAISTASSKSIDGDFVAGELFSKQTVLLCEDSEPIAALLQVLLEREGATVFHCINGLEGLTRFEQLQNAGTPPDVVIMDMQMPVMSGYEAVRRIKALGNGAPIVALTAFALKEDAQRCLDAGCDFYLNKPINTKTFAHELSRMCHTF